MFPAAVVVLPGESPSSRRAWIEICFPVLLHRFVGVALLAEGVDRNFCDFPVRLAHDVALLAEGVDRNFASSGMNDVDEVALLAEGVDRNRLYGEGIRLTAVALLAEGVDRNFRPRALSCPEIVSPSSRRAWIEIGIP